MYTTNSLLLPTIILIGYSITSIYPYANKNTANLRHIVSLNSIPVAIKALGSANMVYHMLCVGRIKITIISPNCINIMSINAKYFFNLISPISSLHISHSNNINSKIIYLLFQPLPLYTYN